MRWPRGDEDGCMSCGKGCELIHDHMIWREPSVLEGFESSLLESSVHISGKP